jgi:hypothetical protein
MQLSPVPARLLDLKTYDEGEKECVVADSLALHVIRFEGRRYVAIVLNAHEFPSGYAALLDFDDMAALARGLNAGAAELYRSTLN